MALLHKDRLYLELATKNDQLEKQLDTALAKCASYERHAVDAERWAKRRVDDARASADAGWAAADAGWQPQQPRWRTSVRGTLSRSRPAALQIKTVVSAKFPILRAPVSQKCSVFRAVCLGMTSMS